MSLEPCLAFRFESAAFVGRLKIEYHDPELDVSELRAFVESAIAAWAAGERGERGAAATRATSSAAAPAPPPEDGAATAAALVPRPTLAIYPHGFPGGRRAARVPQERLERAAEMGRAWGGFVRGERAMPAETPPTGPKAAVWAVLRPAATARWPSWASVHNRCGTLTDESDGYWSRVAVATAWAPKGSLVLGSVFAAFASLEEALSYFDAAGLQPGQVLDLRAGRPAPEAT